MYEVFDDHLLVQVVRAGHRRDIYRRQLWDRRAEWSGCQNAVPL